MNLITSFYMSCLLIKKINCTSIIFNKVNKFIKITHANNKLNQPKIIDTLETTSTANLDYSLYMLNKAITVCENFGLQLPTESYITNDHGVVFIFDFQSTDLLPMLKIKNINAIVTDVNYDYSSNASLFYNLIQLILPGSSVLTIEDITESKEATKVELDRLKHMMKLRIDILLLVVEISLYSNQLVLMALDNTSPFSTNETGIAICKKIDKMIIQYKSKVKEFLQQFSLSKVFIETTVKA